MNRDRLSWGLVLLFIGTMWLLSNTGVISFYWMSLWRFWPVFLIIVGVNLLLPRHSIGNAVSVLATVAALVFVGFQAAKPNHAWKKDIRFNYRDEEDNTDWKADSGDVQQADFASPYQASISRAQLEIKGGAVEYKMSGTSNELFSAHTSGVFARHVLQRTTRDSIAELSFRMKSKKGKSWNFDEQENEAQLALNVNPIWSIRVDVGAGAVDFDLSGYKVQRLDLKGGAASFETKLGMPIGESIIKAESGVANVEVAIPKEAAAKIVVKSGLSSKDFPGFEKRGDGSYVTEGFEQANDKFLIDFKGGLSSFSVKRY